MSSCYLRSRRGCHTAYGDPGIKEIFVIPDPEFFNLFYAKNRKHEFLKNNTAHYKLVIYDTVNLMIKIMIQ